MTDQPTKTRPGDQPLPTGGQECVQDALIRLIEDRKQLGIQRYGSALMTHNGRDAGQDMVEEAVDLAVYSMQVAMELRDLRGAVAELAQAIRLTREYVGEELLPAVEGWSWYDALRRWAPHELPGPAAAEVTEAERTTRVFAALHRSAEETVTRVIALHEQWVMAGPPPLGTSMSRWWDARLVELHDAILPPADQTTEK